MTVLVSDDFNRAGPALGANWDINTADGDNAGFVISSNVAIPGSTSNDNSATNNSIVWPNDQAVTVTFVATGAAGVGAGCGPMCRSVTSGQTYYRAVGNASGYQLSRAVAGVYTTLSSGSGTTFAAADTMTLQLAGAVWTLKKNGATFASGTDGSPIASGRGGIGYSSTDTTTRIDNFLGEDVAAGDTLMGQACL